MKNWPGRIRQSNSSQRRNKTELLPLPKSVRDVLSLQYHLQLEALRAGVGSLVALQTLVRVAMATKMLIELGYGERYERPTENYLDVATDAFDAGSEGHYALGGDAIKLFASLLTAHDAQLEAAPVRVIDIIAQRLDGPRSA